MYKKTNYIHFAQQPEPSIRDQIEKVFNYSNHLIDCFIDYNLSNFPEIYVLYIDYIKEIINEMRGIDTNQEFYKLLGGFLKYYISCLEEAIKAAPPYKPNDFDFLKIFIENALEKLKQE